MCDTCINLFSQCQINLFGKSRAPYIKNHRETGDQCLQSFMLRAPFSEVAPRLLFFFNLKKEFNLKTVTCTLKAFVLGAPPGEEAP